MFYLSLNYTDLNGRTNLNNLVVFTSSTRLKTSMAAKCTKNKNCACKARKTTFFHFDALVAVVVEIS